MGDCSSNLTLFLVHGDPSRGGWGKALFMQCLQGCCSLGALYPWRDTVLLIAVPHLCKLSSLDHDTYALIVCSHVLSEKKCSQGKCTSLEYSVMDLSEKSLK